MSTGTKQKISLVIMLSTYSSVVVLSTSCDNRGERNEEQTRFLLSNKRFNESGQHGKDREPPADNKIDWM